MKKMILIIALLIGCVWAKPQKKVLVPGDGIRIFLYNIAETVSGDYFIESDSTIRLPFLSKIYVGSRDFEDIKKEIYTEYDKIYKNPELAVLPLFKVNILGEVRTPGAYYVTGVEKLSDLIAKAGGTTADADLDDIYVLRNDKEFIVDGEDIILDGDKSNDITMQSGDRVYVSRQWWVSARNTSFLISAVAVVISIIGLFLR